MRFSHPNHISFYGILFSLLNLSKNVNDEKYLKIKCTYKDTH